ncbi:glutathione-regulated potassium-efflux system oxidoreductase KefF [Ulvibacter litoralis]|uniref:Glutathione-regulated potassium-efflux system ancillary protein KefG n=1 Tax=Ulvibacter litoralis TaxID=227084 RepID=A0A1G7FJ74_9FLAO|nr:NAD(P)H-dependent oxidoreductase [Ulvibacter litoralis]GHC50889.1 NAD(P)H oxidoreductase [Ulvibacter litoralis]SDE75966.1 glutathione-regulated potassium-efflux system ancillary protein KefG [Ulvibacter litoralis]
MKKILVLFSHPKFEKSRANTMLVDRIKDVEGVTFHDLYERYPDFHIDVPAEKELLNQHDIIIWHHPFYWYSCPPLMKQWIDMVLEFGWAYGPNGNALQAKTCLNVITTGGSRDVYCSEGTNSFTVNQFLRPFEQTANLCGMAYLPPFAVMGTHKLSDEELALHVDQYGTLITLLQQDFSLKDFNGYFFLNDIPQLQAQ